MSASSVVAASSEGMGMTAEYKATYRRYWTVRSTRRRSAAWSFLRPRHRCWLWNEVSNQRHRDSWERFAISSSQHFVSPASDDSRCSTPFLFLYVILSFLFRHNTWSMECL